MSELTKLEKTEALVELYREKWFEAENKLEAIKRILENSEEMKIE